MFRKKRKSQGVVGVAVAGGEARALFLRASDPDRRIERTARLPWPEEGRAAALRALVEEATPGLRPDQIRLAFVLADPSQTMEVKSFPEMKEEEFLRAASWHFRKNRRTFLENPSFGAWLQEREEGREEGVEAILVETNGEEVDLYGRLAARLGSVDPAVVPEAFAVDRLVRETALSAAPGETELVLIENEGEGTITAFDGGRLLLHRTVDLKIDPFELHLPEAAPGEGGVGTATIAETTTRLSTAKLVTEIQRTEQYLSTRFHAAPASIALVGGDEELARLLARETGLAVRPVPLTGPGEAPLDLDLVLPYGAARLALAGQRTGLLPQAAMGSKKKKRSLLARLPTREMRRGAYLALPLVLAALTAIEVAVYLLERKATRIEEDLATLDRLRNDPAAERRLARWEREALTVNHYRSLQQVWSGAFHALDAVLPPEVVLEEVLCGAPEVVLPEGEVADEEGDPLLWLLEEETQGGEEARAPEMIFRGRAPAIGAVRRLVDALERRPEFREATLASAERLDEGEGKLAFEIDCEPLVERRLVTGGGGRER